MGCTVSIIQWTQLHNFLTAIRDNTLEKRSIGMWHVRSAGESKDSFLWIFEEKRTPRVKNTPHLTQLSHHKTVTQSTPLIKRNKERQHTHSRSSPPKIINFLQQSRSIHRIRFNSPTYSLFVTKWIRSRKQVPQ